MVLHLGTKVRFFFERISQDGHANCLTDFKYTIGDRQPGAYVVEVGDRKDVYNTP